MADIRDLELRIERVWGAVLRAFAAVNGVVILFLAVMISTDVLVRWIAGRPIIGVFEISRVLFVPVIFMVLALVQFADRHVKVDLLVSHLKGRRAVAVRVLDQAMALVFFTILLVTGWRDWVEAIERNYVGMGRLEIPQAIPIGFVVFGVFLMVVTLVLLILKSLRQFLTGVGEKEPLVPYSPPLREE
ncbi:MAG: TRAP transporter small permease [Proteobacteria bacterium]|nr:TRAP transporter small permease [Pseudomonadota bacterium]